MLFFKRQIKNGNYKYVSRFFPHLIIILSVIFSFICIAAYDFTSIRLLIYAGSFFLLILITLFSIWLYQHPVIGLFGLKNMDFQKSGKHVLSIKDPLVILVKRK